MAITYRVATALNVNGTTPLAVSTGSAPVLNDILDAFVTTNNGDTVTGPALFSKISTADGGVGNQKLEHWRKTAGASEGTSYSFSSTGGTISCIELYIATGADSTTPQDVADSTNVQASTTSPTATGVTTVTPGCLIEAAHVENNQTAAMTLDASLTADTNQSATGIPCLTRTGSLTQSAAGPTGNKVGSYVGATAATSILVAVRPLVSSSTSFTLLSPPISRFTLSGSGG